MQTGTSAYPVLAFVEGHLDGDGFLRHQPLRPNWDVVGVTFDDGSIGKTEEDARLMAVNREEDAYSICLYNLQHISHGAWRNIGVCPCSYYTIPSIR